ncbi:YdaU family protein [Comamonas sediminis]|uniref:YdaU family protein n=1 Tax=Comamonas sediminis TaxID=1783360 RepID=A0ABV4B7Z8_9BURK
MNHYPHHIGDFRSATRHLTFVERALYRELLDLYYDTERPLNADLQKLARLVLAQGEEQCEALSGVLDEFFVLQDDGWHNDRCDAEIEAYRGKVQSASAAGKKSAEARRSKASERSGRSSARKDIPSSGGGAPGGDGGVAQEHKQSSSDNATTVERPLNDGATNQNQNQYVKETSSPKAQSADDDVPQHVGDWVAVFGSEFGVEVSPTNRQDRQKFWPLATSWVASGVSVGQMRRACSKARAEAREGIAYLPAYLDRVLASQSAAAAAPVETVWQKAARERVEAGAPFAAAANPSTGDSVIDGFAFFDSAAAAHGRRLEVSQ